MIQIYNNKHLTWDGTTSINYYEFFADTVTDLPNDPYYFSSEKGRYKIAQGSIAWIIDVSEIYMFDSEGNWVLETVSGGGGGGGGTTNYNALTNKPSINSVELSGNKTLSDLGIQPLIDSSHKLSADNVSNGTTNKFNMQADWNQADNTAGDYIKNKPTLGTAAATDATAYATSAQGTKADSAIQSVKIGGTALTPDSNKAVNITSIPSSVTATTQSQKDNSTKIATTAYVDKAVDDLPEPMVWTGTITITADVSDTTKCSIVVSSPASSTNIKTGFTYKIASIADTPAYTGTLKVGDTMIAAKDAPTVTSTWTESTDWNVVPSGDEPSGTVMSVTASNGLKTASGAAITSTGDIQANLASTTALSGNTIYNVGLNNSGNLAVKVPTVSKTAVGLTPQLPNESTTTKFLRQDGSWEVPAYTTVAEGSADGSVKVNGTDVSVHGLKSAAYTESSAYATSTQGGKADSAIQTVKRNGSALTPDANKAVDVACIESLGSTPTANDIATWNTSTGLKDSGVSIETNTTFSESSDTKIPTSKSIATNVASKAVLTGYSVDTSRSNITSSSTIRDAVEQLEYREELNKNNILLLEQANGAKNLCKLKSTIGNFSPVTVSVSSDKKITLNTTSATTSAVSQTITDAITVTPNQQYVISGCGGTGSVKLVVRDKATTGAPWIVQQYGNAVTFTPTTNSIDVIIYVNSSITLTDFVISPMIITKSAHDAGFTDYQPYAFSNTAITPALVECVDNGKKNLFKTTLNQYTHNGVVFDKVNDYTIKLTTASAISAQASCTISDVTFPQNKYAIKVVADGISLANDNVFVNIVYDVVGGSPNQNQNITDVLVFRNNTIIIKQVLIYVRSGKQPNGTIQVMICPTALYDISDKIQPYALPNTAITPALQECVDNGVKNLLDTSQVTVSNITFTPNSSTWYVTASPNNSDPRTWEYANCQYKAYLKPGNYVFVLDIDTATTTSGSGFMVYSEVGTAIQALTSITNKTGRITCDIYIRTAQTYGFQIKQYGASIRYMLCKKSLYDADQTYQPYAMTNVELTEALNPTAYTVPDISTTYRMTVDSGGYFVVGKVCYVNVRITLIDDIPNNTYILYNLPEALKSDSLATGSSICALSNSRNAYISVASQGNILNYSGNTLTAGLLVISGAYLIK